MRDGLLFMCAEACTEKEGGEEGGGEREVPTLPVASSHIHPGKTIAQSHPGKDCTVDTFEASECADMEC